ncbi:hypothetical protein HO173_011508 [Letharia columbiana]|uniref:Uncharacterized protein n=1 Tax=Letharia columbiana TaxID=112416 RepID=A0A8H6KZ00_9LECA|nr:uncharacterized protein HO173_011508 [Letharia columbiana]KAF6229468.1 hypothetical protein HO173_011508 [Letharia columbiana]
MAVPFQLTTDGFERQWQTNHLAPFLLTKTLLPIVESTAVSSSSKNRVRIINVADDAALLPPAPKLLDLARPNLEYVTGAMNGWKRYGHSKIASITHARALHDRLHGKGISVHPGIVATNLQSADPSLFGSFVRHMVRWYVKPCLPAFPFPTRFLHHSRQKFWGNKPFSPSSLSSTFMSLPRPYPSYISARRGDVDAILRYRGGGGGYVAPFGKLGKRADWWNQDEGLVEELWVESEGMIKGAGF